jgi:hypothetical protein
MAKGCKTCKKGKEVTELEEVIIPEEVILIENDTKPSIEELKNAYADLSAKELTENQKRVINKVFLYLFKEEFDFACSPCGNIQARKLKFHLTNILNIKV